MDSKITTTKPKNMRDVFEKSRKYDSLQKENEELKKKIISLEGAIDGYKEIYNYLNSVIDNYNRMICNLVDTFYCPENSSCMAEELQEVLRNIIDDDSPEAKSTKKLFKERYSRLYPVSTYNPFDEICIGKG